MSILYCEGLVKNCYVGWIFIMSGQVECKKFVCCKFNVVLLEFDGYNVFLIDDFIVWGNILQKIVEMCCQVGVKKVYVVFVFLFVKFLNVYGIDMLICYELIVYDKINEEICVEIGVDGLIY